MSHDRIKAAARRRMAETGEPYATARREVIKEHKAAGGRRDPVPGPQRFALSYDTPRVDALLGIGPGSSGVEVDADQIRVGWGGASGWTSRGVRSVPLAGPGPGCGERAACTAGRGDSW
jgi:hypothetical protein